MLSQEQPFAARVEVARPILNCPCTAAHPYGHVRRELGSALPKFGQRQHVPIRAVSPEDCVCHAQIDLPGRRLLAVEPAHTLGNDSLPGVELGQPDEVQVSVELRLDFLDLTFVDPRRAQNRERPPRRVEQRASVHARVGVDALRDRAGEHEQIVGESPVWHLARAFRHGRGAESSQSVAFEATLEERGHNKAHYQNMPRTCRSECMIFVDPAALSKISSSTGCVVSASRMWS